MKTATDIIDAFGYARLAELTGIPAGTVAAWKHRDAIPSGHWLRVVEAAHEADLPITLRLLASIHERKIDDSGRAA
jgi:hypothetical protein